MIVKFRRKLYANIVIHDYSPIFFSAKEEDVGNEGNIFDFIIDYGKTNIILQKIKP